MTEQPAIWLCGVHNKILDSSFRRNPGIFLRLWFPRNCYAIWLCDSFCILAIVRL
jgi:hypothetical protein